MHIYYYYRRKLSSGKFEIDKSCVYYYDASMNIVYVIENIDDGMSYVGITYCLDSRWKAHIIESRKEKKTPIGLAIAKKGPENFRMRELATTEGRREAIGYERLFTHLLESNDPRFGYNTPKIYK